MRGPLARSLSLRLLGIFAATAFLLVALLVALFTHGLSSQWRRSIGPHLVQYARYVQEDLGSPPEPARARALADALPVTIAIYRNDRLVHATDGHRPALETLRFRRVPPPVQRRLARPDARTARAPPMIAAISRERRRGGTVLRIERGADTVYYFLRSPSGRRGGGEELYLALLGVALVLLASYLLIRRQLAPIRRIQRGVRRMSEGELAHRLALDGADDLAELGHSIDEMAARIGDMLDAKRQLLLAISHELRSPLARARVATELLPASRQRERLEADLADMARLIEDLTESERLRTPHAALGRERLDLVRLITEELAAHALVPRLIGFGTSVARRIPPADGSESVDGSPSGARATNEPALMLFADAARLRVLVRNLVVNAARHGRSADGEAHVEVTLTRRRHEALLDVTDRGPGIAPEHLEAVTEPFHRTDAARTRASGGVGLGLSLARLIAEAHGGSLRLTSDPATAPGTRVTVTLPLDTETPARKH